MRIQNVVQFGAAALLSVMMVACKSTDDAAETAAPAETAARTAPAGPNDGLTDAQRAERDRALATRIFYFEFDKSDLSAEARAALVHHANQLKANPSTRYRLEGHADERGTREYNLALGERRAQAIERYLQVQGVSATQLETISYGEERPAETGTTEAAYSKNRRVEIK
jgi:peptidoglycan-associated lipoprotein